MKILLISSPSRKGAGKVSFDLKDQLEKLGHEVFVLSRYKDVDDNVLSPAINENLLVKIFHKIIAKIKVRAKKYHFFDGEEYKITRIGKETYRILPKEIDLIIISFYQNFLNFHFFNEIYNKYKAPIVFWMMDMAIFTGGCHYSWSCQRYKNECGRCPALKSNTVKDLSYRNLNYKKEVIQNWKVSVIAISKYQQSQAKESSLLKTIPVSLIYHALDLNLYKPVENRLILKYKKGIKDDIVLFFVASNIEEYRKGFNHFLEALKRLDKNLINKISVILAGRSIKNYGTEFNNINVIQKGTLNHSSIIEYYQLSNYTVVPTFMDSGPLTVMESLACGTPVITYNIGIGKDVIINNVNGFVSEVGIENLERNIKEALNASDKKFQKMAINARETAEKYFSKEMQIDKLKEFLRNGL